MTDDELLQRLKGSTWEAAQEAAIKEAFEAGYWCGLGDLIDKHAPNEMNQAYENWLAEKDLP